VFVILPALDGPDGDPIGPVAELLERRWGALHDAPELTWSPSPEPLAAVTELAEAKSPDAEARAVVAAVRRALALGTPPERIAVVVPSLDETSLEPLRHAFDEASLPFSEPRGRSPLRSPEARVITLLLALAEGPVTRDHLIELLRAPGLHAGHWVERGAEGDAAVRATRLAHRLRELPVRSDPSGSLFVDALAALLRERGSSFADGGASELWMVRALQRIVDSLHTLRGEATRAERARRLAALVQRLELGRPSAAELRAALGAEKGGFGAHALAALGEGAAAVRAAQSALDAIVSAVAAAGTADALCSPGELLAELEQAIEAFPLTPPGARVGAVRITRAAELAGLSHELVIVTGLDGVSPGEGGGALAGGDDDELAFSAGFDPASRARREVERYAELSWVMARARSVVLTRAPRSASEELGEPHPAVRVALRRGTPRRSEPASRLSPEASVTSRAGARLVTLARGGVAEKSVLARVRIEQQRLAFFLDPKAEPGPHTGRVVFDSPEEAAHLRALVGGESPARTIAATAIERATGCAFAAFAGRALRVRRVEDVAEAASSRDRGNLVHRALRAVFDGLRDRLSSNDPAALLRAARSIAERALALGEGASDAQPPLRREAVRQAVEETLCAFAWSLSDGASSAFALAEQGFGPRGNWPALELHGDGPSVFVDGQIDRIDRTTDGRRIEIMDYKTGKPPKRADQGRTLFQLPLYAEITARVLGEPNELFAYYVQIGSGGAVHVAPEKEEERRLPKSERDEALATARETVLRLWTGDVAARPPRLATCTYCDARDVCRRPAVMPEESSAD
jgi:ATP-dependent helicase/nuclease subunit B